MMEQHNQLIMHLLAGFMLTVVGACLLVVLITAFWPKKKNGDRFKNS